MNGACHQVLFLRTIFGKERGPVAQNAALDIERRFNHVSISTFLDRSRDGALYLPNHAMLLLFGLHRLFLALARESIEASIPDTRHWCTHEVVHTTGAPLQM